MSVELKISWEFSDPPIAAKRWVKSDEIQVQPDEHDSKIDQNFEWPKGTAASAMARAESSLPRLFARTPAYGYLLGDGFSNADIYAYHLLAWAEANGADIPEHVREYMHGLGERPGCPDSIKPRRIERPQPDSFEKFRE